MKKSIVLLCLAICFFPLQAQKLELVKRQWDAIKYADDPEEKLHRSQILEVMLNTATSEQVHITDSAWFFTPTPDLSSIKGLSELVSEDSVFRIFSWAFPLEEGKYQYSMANQFSINDSLMCSTAKCTNYLGLNCSPRTKGKCRKSNYVDEWVGAVYYDIKKEAKHQYLLSGYHFENNDTTLVKHRFYYDGKHNYRLETVTPTNDFTLEK